MARIRSIKPEFPADEKLATVSRDARLTFVLLITQVDDKGLILASPRQLLGLLYPLDESVSAAILSAWIDELVAIGRVRRRQTRDGAPVLELVSWLKHQRIDKPTESKIDPLLVPLAKDSRAIREPLTNVQRIEAEAESGVGRRRAEFTVPAQGESAEDLSTPPRVENPPAPPAAPLVACATRNGNSHSGTAPLPYHASRLLHACYGTAPEKRQADVAKQLAATLNGGAVFERGQKVQAVDAEHLDSVCSVVLDTTLRKPDAAIRIVLVKLAESFGEVNAARQKASHAPEPPRRRIASAQPERLSTLVRLPE